MTPTERAQLISDAIEGDPGEANEPALCSCGHGYTGHDAGHDAAAAILRATGQTAYAAENARQAHSAARDAAYAAESAQRQAQEAAKAAEAEAVRLIRALMRAGDEATSGPSEHGNSTEYHATFGWAIVHTTASSGRWSSKAQPQVATAYGYEAGSNGGTDLYHSERGTSDPDKLAAELAKAHEAGARWAADHTARAWLDAHGITGEPDDLAKLAAALVAVDFELRAGWYSDASYLSPEWRVSANGARLNDGRALNSWDLYPDTAERDALTTGEPTPPTERTPEAWRAYEAALDAKWNTPENTARALRLALR